MSIKVIVMLNDTEIASATISNVSGLADISDYSVVVNERGDSRLGITSFNHETDRVLGHNRKQSVWALVKKVADIAVRKSYGQ